MAKQTDRPFDRYVQRVLAYLPQLSPEQQQQIKAELRAHLDDAAAELGASPENPQLQQRVIGELGSSRRVGRDLARTYRVRRTPAQIGLLGVTIVRAIVATLATLAFLMYALVALMVVPAPSAETAVEVSGKLAWFSRPHDSDGDLSIALDSGRSYYVNRVYEVEYFQWQRMLEEVRPGDTLHLTVVRPLAWRLGQQTVYPKHGPVAGVRSDTTVYMDPAIPAVQWTAQRDMLGLMLGALAVLGLCVTPELRRLLRGRAAGPQGGLAA